MQHGGALYATPKLTKLNTLFLCPSSLRVIFALFFLRSTIGSHSELFSLLPPRHYASRLGRHFFRDKRFSPFLPRRLWHRIAPTPATIVRRSQQLIPDFSVVLVLSANLKNPTRLGLELPLQLLRLIAAFEGTPTLTHGGAGQKGGLLRGTIVNRTKYSS